VLLVPSHEIAGVGGDGKVYIRLILGVARQGKHPWNSFDETALARQHLKKGCHALGCHLGILLEDPRAGEYVADFFGDERAEDEFDSVFFSEEEAPKGGTGVA